MNTVRNSPSNMSIDNGGSGRNAQPAAVAATAGTNTLTALPHMILYRSHQPEPPKVDIDWNIMVDVRMDEFKDDDDKTLCDPDPDYRIGVPSHDPKLMFGPSVTRHVRSSRRSTPKRTSTCGRADQRRPRWCCFWLVLFVLGWILSFMLFALLMQQLKAPNSKQDLVWESADTDESDDTWTPQDYKNMEDEAMKKPFILRINAGSAHDITDMYGNVWIKDNVALSEGLVTAVTTTGVDDGGPTIFTVSGDGSLYSESSDETWSQTHLSNAQHEGKDLYRDERWFNTTGTYEIPVPDDLQSGNTTLYDVTLYFCELFYDEPLERVFQVYIEDDPVLGGPTLDLVAMGGGTKLAVLPIQRLVQVRDGRLTIRFESLVEHAKISAIQIIRIDSS